MTRTRLFALSVALVLATAALADRETAQFSSSRGDKALAAKKFEEADGLYRKALEEDETFLPARYGLAQALIGEGNSAQAVEELRKFLEVSHAATTTLPADWKALVVKAEKQIGDLDAAGTALQKIEDGYVEGLVDFAQRWSAKDAVVAERALRRALKMKPGHARAVQLLEKMGKSTASDIVDLFDGQTLGGWELANPPYWQIVDGDIVGAVRDSTFYCRSVRTFEGNFDVHVEARLVEEYAGQTYFAVMPCWKSDYDHYSIGLIRGKVWWSDTSGSGKDRDVASVAPPQLKKPFDAKQWNTYELRFRGNQVIAAINGDEVAKEPRPESRKGGFVGLVVQDAKVAFRKIQVEVR